MEIIFPRIKSVSAWCDEKKTSLLKKDKKKREKKLEHHVVTREAEAI